MATRCQRLEHWTWSSLPVARNCSDNKSTSHRPKGTGEILRDTECQSSTDTISPWMPCSAISSKCLADSVVEWAQAGARVCDWTFECDALEPSTATWAEADR